MPASQAGRRGFEPRLPLHLFNNLAHSASPDFTAFTSITQFARGFLFCSLFRLLAASQGALKFCDCFETAFKIAFSIRIEGDPDRMPSLICSHLRIQLFFVSETSLRPAQHLEVDPTETDVLKFLLDVPPQKIIPRQKGAALGVSAGIKHPQYCRFCR